ncbi:MAG: ImmA/IrrE family metallo-endopeptidase [Treponema sp.]|jgi:Zn-dependent peptidase ImmA (M78 family)|nr:ImmA/IrrE family metallo-endopeptidase [Treponema sp.]
MIAREQIGNIADSIRKPLGLTCPYDPEKAVSLLNGTIQPISIDHKIDAAIKKNGEDSFIIYLNTHEPYLRKRFTVAHELGHLFLHMGYLIDNEKWNSIPDDGFQDSAYFRMSDNYSQEENEANEFAASFLMPKAEFIEFAKQHLSNNQYTIKPIAGYFKVSESAAINRGKWLGIFTW